MLRKLDKKERQTAILIEKKLEKSLEGENLTYLPHHWSYLTNTKSPNSTHISSSKPQSIYPILSTDSEFYSTFKNKNSKIRKKSKPPLAKLLKKMRYNNYRRNSSFLLGEDQDHNSKSKSDFISEKLSSSIAGLEEIQKEYDRLMRYKYSARLGNSTRIGDNYFKSNVFYSYKRNMNFGKKEGFYKELEEGFDEIRVKGVKIGEKKLKKKSLKVGKKAENLKNAEGDDDFVMKNGRIFGVTRRSKSQNLPEIENSEDIYINNLKTKKIREIRRPFKINLKVNPSEYKGKNTNILDKNLNRSEELDEILVDLKKKLGKFKPKYDPENIYSDLNLKRKLKILLSKEKKYCDLSHFKRKKITNAFMDKKRLDKKYIRGYYGKKQSLG